MSNVFVPMAMHTKVQGKRRAHLLQVKLAPWHLPFHLLGGEPSPSSLKLSDSGQIPTTQQMWKNFKFEHLLCYLLKANW